MGRVLTPLGVHRFLKTFHASSTYNIKPAFSYYGSLVMGYSRCQIVAPPIADLSLCLRTNRGATWFSGPNGIHVALPIKCPNILAFLCTPWHPLS